MTRDGIDAALAYRMIASRVRRERRIVLATAAFVNGGRLHELATAVNQLHSRFLSLALNWRADVE